MHTSSLILDSFPETTHQIIIETLLACISMYLRLQFEMSNWRSLEQLPIP
ncbi:hypothetical protein I8748_16850 [Nostoc sp. CENA67]|uniref:Uncharacterized protein n=1 Tax=Amazonocrinis nigriterrae CENA67 TaxID=2794033 RepID=A0A8J7L7W1_9NOST|nr:hypothetical protein [Amazonocrinis nigriterrae]MBH8563839.1 hypothetical protein [Amazonocrinis nigriterrae CENA67]